MEDNREMIRRLMIAVNKIDGLYYFAAKKLGLKANSLALLYALDDGQPHSQKRICEEWLIPRTTINTVVKECVAKGYAAFCGERQSREKLLVITPAGKAYVQEIMSGLYQAEKGAMERAEKDFTDGFVTAMEGFAEYLQQGFFKQDLISGEK